MVGVLELEMEEGFKPVNCEFKASPLLCCLLNHERREIIELGTCNVPGTF